LRQFLQHILFFFLVFFAVQNIYATHLIGGEITYDHLGNGNYKIRMEAYRDCFNGIPPLDDPCLIRVYDVNNAEVMSFTMALLSINPINPSINNPCVEPPEGVCVEEGIYETTVNLPPKAGGYYLVYRSCCRNNSILNIISPGNTGVTYWEHIPGPEVVLVNSSPRFTKFPPIYTCNGTAIAFDHSATDPDGDVLVYSLCAPHDSTNVAPPYPGVFFTSPYSGSYPLSSSPAISINPTTGFLNGVPNINGQWVVGVCIQEFRGSTLIGTHFRDFQFNVVDCVYQVESQFNDQSMPIGSSPNQYCVGNTIKFINYSVGGLKYHWDFGVAGIQSDTSNLSSPSYTYPDTGRYVVSLITNPGTPCCDTTTAVFYVYPKLDPIFVAPAGQCFEGHSFNFTVGGSYASYATFYWIFGTSATPPNATVFNPSNIVYNGPGKYPVWVDVKQMTCKKTLKDTIEVIDIDPPVFSTDSVKACDPATVILQNSTVADGNPTYHWSFSDGGTSNDKNPVHTFSPSGIYDATISIITTGACIDTSTFVVPGIVTVFQKPEAQFSYTPDSVTVFDADIFFINESMYSSHWTWNFGDENTSASANPLHHYSAYGDFIVTLNAYNEAGCTDEAKRKIKILPEFKFWVPNCFTPGQTHGLNDVFTPIVICAENYEFYIYDRWGQRLFKSNVAGEGWDGTFRGKLCEQATYTWYIKFKNAETSRLEEHYGHLTLLK
jgi:gliding motility-associated-like protein